MPFPQLIYGHIHQTNVSGVGLLVRGVSQTLYNFNKLRACLEALDPFTGEESKSTLRSLLSDPISRGEGKKGPSTKCLWDHHHTPPWEPGMPVDLRWGLQRDTLDL
jgi:hypothetical protein